MKHLQVFWRSRWWLGLLATIVYATALATVPTIAASDADGYAAQATPDPSVAANGAAGERRSRAISVAVRRGDAVASSA